MSQRSGEFWSASEIAGILDLVRQGRTYGEIALLHGRSIVAIQARFQKIAAELYQYEGLSFADIKARTGLSDQTLILTLADTIRRPH
jgi:hypothetical protein